jgi:ribosomal-protein-alanine N-acetyltransferase
MNKSWPVALKHGDVRLRPLKKSDAKKWREIRAANQDWMQEWEATPPIPAIDPAPTFRQSAKRLLQDAKEGRAMPFVVEYQDEFVGQLNVSDIVYGSLRGAHFGYWIDHRFAGRGIMTTAVALVTEHLLTTCELHRVEVAIRPENEPSNKLVQRLGFRFEGQRAKFLHINNDWRDHNIYVMFAEDLQDSLLARLKK